MFSGRSILIAKIFGISIEIDYSWLIVFGLVVWTLSLGFFPINFPQFTTSTNVFLGIITSLAFFASVIIHELAHSLVALKNGLDVHKITLFIFGGAAQITEEPKTAFIEFKISIAGPLSSLLLAGLFWLILFIFPLWPEIIQAPLLLLAEVNLILGIFNLIPGYPMDGGRIFRSIIWHFNHNYYKSTKIAAVGGKLISLSFIVLGSYIAIIFGNFSGIWIALVGAFLYQAAGSALKQVQLRQILEHVKVWELMEKPISIPQEISLTTAFENYFNIFRTGAFPVTAGQNLIGMVTINDIKLIPKNLWPTTSISSVTKQFDETYAVNEEDEVLKALSIMDIKQISSVPVKNRFNQLVGSVSNTNLNYYLKLKI